MQNRFRRISLWLLLGIAALALFRARAVRTPHVSRRPPAVEPLRVRPAVDWREFHGPRPARLAARLAAA